MFHLISYMSQLFLFKIKNSLPVREEEEQFIRVDYFFRLPLVLDFGH